MSVAYVVGQSLGFIALCVGLTVYLQRSERQLKHRLALYTVIMSGHFFLLGAYPAAFSAAISAVRTIVSIYYQKVWVMYLLMLLVGVLGLSRLSHWMEILPIAGALMGTYALFKLKGLPMRYLMWCSTFCWTIFNVWLGSIGGSVIEGVFLMMNTITTYRLRKMVLDGKNPFE